MTRASFVVLAVVVVGCGDKRSMALTEPSRVLTLPSVATGFTVSGRVTAGSQVIAGARVVVETGTSRLETITDARGQYILQGVASTICSITAMKDGYERIERSVPLNRDMVVDFELVPIC